MWFGPCWTAHKTVQRSTASAAWPSLPQSPVPFQAPKGIGLSELRWIHGRPAAGGQEGRPGASQTTLDASVQATELNSVHPVAESLYFRTHTVHRNSPQDTALMEGERSGVL